MGNKDFFSPRVPPGPWEEHEFLWGVATSAYQSEGGYNRPGEPLTNWAYAEQRKSVMRLGDAAAFLEHYREDFRRCREMGLNAFRIGLEWSRIQPSFSADRTAGAPPPFSQEALQRYADVIAAARTEGMEPVVTLHHFVHPAWLGSDPWLEEEVVPLFTRYVTETTETINRALVDRHGLAPIRYYITINEPNMLVLNTYLGNQFPGRGSRGPRSIVTAYTQLLRAHVAAYNAVHDLYERHRWPRPALTLNNYCSDLYWSDKLILDLLSLREYGCDRGGVHDFISWRAKAFERAFAAARIPLHKDLPYLFGAFTKRIANWLGYRRFDGSSFAPFLEDLYESPRSSVFDYIGLDYYDPFLAHMFRFPVFWDHEFRDKSVRSWVMNTITSKWWDWRVLPRGLHFFCETYSREFGDRPVLIAENGMALRRRPDNSTSGRRDKMSRSDFLRLHVHEVERIVKQGVPLIGYLHWSLFDNYEWGSYTPRFGLYSIDYSKGTERLVEDHTGDRPSETYARLIREARERSQAQD
jgi:beta-glucosidase